MMKLRIFGTVVAVATASGAWSAVPAELLQSFRQLAGNGGNEVTVSNLPQARAEVWQAWKEANAGFNEERLPAIQPLDSTATGAWHIPPRLEPDAVMPFYFGHKGEGNGSAQPLFIYLHGSGDKRHEWSTGLKLAQRFDDAPSIYFVPQIPNEGEYYRWWQQSKQYVWNRLLRQALLNDSIDPDRIYMLGISEGGYGSQRLASFYADYLAAAGPMAGGEPLKNAPAENLRNIAFSLRTGDHDFGFYRNQLTMRTAHELDSLQALYPDGFTHFVELVLNSGHGINYYPTTPWLKQFTRNATPMRVSWEDFDMDGLHRTGFYNLRVDSRPAERTRYDLDILNNTVHLRVDTVTYRPTFIDPNWGIALDFERTYTPARSGEVTLFLGPELVDLTKPVQVYVNGRLVHDAPMPLTREALIGSCETFFDPRRLYPAALTIKL